MQHIQCAAFRHNIMALLLARARVRATDICNVCDNIVMVKVI